MPSTNTTNPASTLLKGIKRRLGGKRKDKEVKIEEKVDDMRGEKPAERLPMMFTTSGTRAAHRSTVQETPLDDIKEESEE